MKKCRNLYLLVIVILLMLFTISFSTMGVSEVVKNVDTASTKVDASESKVMIESKKGTEKNNVATKGDAQMNVNKEIHKEESETHVAGKYPIEWNINDVYANNEAWYKDLEEVKVLAKKLPEFRGTLNTAKGIYDYFKYACDGELTHKLKKLSFYPHLKLLLNTIDNEANTMLAKLNHFSVEMQQDIAYVDDEIYKMTLEERKKIFADPILKDYAYALRSYTDEKTVHHSEETSKILAYMGNLVGKGYDTYSILADSNMPYDNITMPDGSTHILDSAWFEHIIYANLDHDFKFDAQKKFYLTPKNLINTYAKLLNNGIEENIAIAKTEGFSSYKEYIFHQNDIEPEIYEKIKKCTHNMLPSFHKYISFLKKKSGFEHFYYIDTLAGVTVNKEKFSYDDSCDIMLKSLGVLGDEYIKGVKEIIEKKHVDVYSKQGKDSGACSTSCTCKEINPYILLNHSDNANASSTLCHEMGHTIYSYLSEHNDKLNYLNNEPGIFTQEVASITNENLFYNYNIKNAKNDNEKNFYIEANINLINGSIIRQMMYSEFEEYCYDIVEEGGALDADDLSNKWMELNHEYYGEDVEFVEPFKYRWSQIPHFYYGFYVYKYATSCAYALGTSNKIFNEESGALSKYLEFLKLGASDKPSKLLAVAGVDPLSDETYKYAKDVYDKLIEDRIKE